ncbi:TPM domain-containing protein [Thermodesulfobacteriota bacterium B35]
MPDRPPGRVVDLAGVIDENTETSLSALLRNLEAGTTVQMAILTVNSLDGEDINTVSLRVAEQWQLGRKGKDNGLLLTVAVRDRKYRFEVGYGLEEILPDSLVGSIGRQALVPYFKKGRYSEGIATATAEIIRVLADHYGVGITGLLPKTVRRQQNRNDGLIFSLIALTIFLLVLRSRRRRPGRGDFSSGGGGAVAADVMGMGHRVSSSSSGGGGATVPPTTVATVLRRRWRRFLRRRWRRFLLRWRRFLLRWRRFLRRRWRLRRWRRLRRLVKSGSG